MTGGRLRSRWLLVWFLASALPGWSADLVDVPSPRLVAIFSEQLLILEQLSEQQTQQSHELQSLQLSLNESRALVENSQQIISGLRTTISSLENGLKRRRQSLSKLSQDLETAQTSQRDSLTLLSQAERSLQEASRRLARDRVLFAAGGFAVGAGLVLLVGWLTGGG